MRKITLYIFIALPWIILSGILVAHNHDVYYEAELLAEVREKIFSNYVDSVASKKLLKGALQGMMSELDEYSEYLDEDMLKQVYENTEGEFVGIGVVLTMENGFLTILSPIEDSPAAEAGILAGDRILAIDGQNTDRWTLEEATLKMRGQQGTTIKLTIRHEGNKTSQDIIIVRKTIQIVSIKGSKIVDSANKVGYMRLTEFNRHTKDELIKNIQNLQQQGMKSLVLDLRFNPGGLMDAAVDVVNLFVSDGIIVYLKGRTAENYRVFRASSQALFENIPLIVLLNKRSASASEIVAGSLQDHRRAKIVGERSYGKGLVQTVISLRDEKTAIKLTTARYYTPSGRIIQKTKEKEGGIVPDISIPISLEEEQKILEQFYQSKNNKENVLDIQLQKSIELLKK